MASGIYKLFCTISGKSYIGQSKNVAQRVKNHFKWLCENCHWNKHLQNSFNIYGRDAFLAEVLEYCDQEVLTEREQFWIDKYGFENLYNMCPAAGSTAGSKRDYPSEETRKKIGDGNRGKFVSLETRQKQSKALVGNQNAKGAKLSEETRKKMSDFKRDWWAKTKEQRVNDGQRT